MPVLRYEVEITPGGYLYLSAALAEAHFPNDAVLATIESNQLILWPTSGAFAGGLILKQRNVSGDRCVLITEVIPANIPPGKKDAVWDDTRFRLAVALHSPYPDQAVGSNTVITEEFGRWVVYLEVGFWDDSRGANPMSITRHRINDYPTRSAAEVAATWIQRSSERNRTHPPEGN